MNIITKVLTIIIFIIMLSILYCKPKEEVPFKRTFIPDKMFGIDFCNLQLIHIVRELQSKQVIFKCYDDETNEEIECNEKNVQRKIINIETEYFIGLKFFNKNIVKIIYHHNPLYDSLTFVIQFSINYYNTLLELLKNQLGAANANVNRHNYGEISWDENPAGKSCIMDITLSKRLKYGDPAKAGKEVCYLVINTRARHPHVH